MPPRISERSFYDAAGNTASYQGVSFTFNQRGRASSVISAGSTTNYIYNAVGQLIEKTVGGVTTLLVYEETGHLLGEYLSTGALIQDTVWMGDVPVATLRPNGSTGCTSALCIFLRPHGSRQLTACGYAA